MAHVKDLTTGRVYEISSCASALRPASGVQVHGVISLHRNGFVALMRSGEELSLCVLGRRILVNEIVAMTRERAAVARCTYRLVLRSGEEVRATVRFPFRRTVARAVGSLQDELTERAQDVLWHLTMLLQSADGGRAAFEQFGRAS